MVFILKFENSCNLFEAKKQAISQWEKLSALFVRKSDEIVAMAKEIMASADEFHVACAIAGTCNYFITVDKQILNYQDKRIVICNPIEFLNIILK